MLAPTRTRVLLAVALLCIASAGCGSPNRPERDPAVVAMVADTPITAATVVSLLPSNRVDGPTVLAPGASPPDPRRLALDQAIRDELFSREAQARRLPVRLHPGITVRAARIRALIDQERRLHRLGADNVSDRQAKAWYARRRHLFDEVDSMQVTWARIGTQASARDLLRQAAGTDHRGFLALLRRHRGRGVDDSGSAMLDHDGHGADALVARIAFALREPGKVGLVPGERGGWWLARVDSVRFHAPRWGESLAHRVRTALAWEAEQQRLGRLASELRRKWSVRAFPDRLAAVRETS